MGAGELGRYGTDQPREARDLPQQPGGRNYATQPMTPRERDLQNKAFRGELRWIGDQWVESQPYDWVQRDEENRAKRMQAEQPDRALDAHNARDAVPGAGTADNTETRRSAWDDVDAADRPPLHELRLEPERATHILHGDRTGGGHMSGTGQPGKTEFPASWDGAAILDAVTAVGFSPDTVRKQWNDRWKAGGTYHDVPITVIIDPDAAIRTAWPDEGGPGVVRNPEGRP